MPTEYRETTLSARRRDLLARVVQAGREDATAAVVFHAAVARREGLSDSEETALDLLERSRQLTAGELAKQSGLAPSSVTGLVDRLERKGLASRTTHPDDHRRVLIELGPDRATRTAPLLADFRTSMEELYATYTDGELEIIAGYLDGAARRLRAAADRLGPAQD